jgi:serine/threonine protein phosphatase PrpC
MLFDHDAKVSGDFAHFADLPRRPTGRGAEDPAGIGTTLTAMLFSGGHAAPAHRRTRAFRLRDGQLRQIAEDHTIGNLVAAGSLADARTACGRQARTVRPMQA